MSLKKEEVLDELSHHLFSIRRCSCPGRYTCKLMSGMFASFLLNSIPRCFIIDSFYHSVVYDGQNTWDVSNGFVLRNYKYPNKDVPSPELIPQFSKWFDPLIFKKNYSDEKLSKASNNITIKELKNLGITTE